MSENTDVSSGSLPSISMANWEQAQELIGKILAAAQPGAVFGQPVTAGDYTLITAAEVYAGGGFGFGGGVGPAQTPVSSAEGIGGQSPLKGRQEATTGGSGGGGGGGSKGRPVAVIVIGPDGVKVKPVFDITRLMLAGITAWGAMAIALRGMRRASKR